MGYHRLSATTPKSNGIKLYESALLMREIDYCKSIEQFDSAANVLEEELTAALPGKRQGLLEKLYDCYQRVWVATISVGDDSATYYGNRTVEIARELERLD